MDRIKRILDATLVEEMHLIALLWLLVVPGIYWHIIWESHPSYSSSCKWRPCLGPARELLLLPSCCIYHIIYWRNMWTVFLYKTACVAHVSTNEEASNSTTNSNANSRPNFYEGVTKSNDGTLHLLPYPSDNQADNNSNDPQHLFQALGHRAESPCHFILSTCFSTSRIIM